jgi:hypothetical protein
MVSPMPDSTLPLLPLRTICMAQYMRYQVSVKYLQPTYSLPPVQYLLPAGRRQLVKVVTVIIQHTKSCCAILECGCRLSRGRHNIHVLTSMETNPSMGCQLMAKTCFASALMQSTHYNQTCFVLGYSCSGNRARHVCRLSVISVTCVTGRQPAHQRTAQLKEDSQPIYSHNYTCRLLLFFSRQPQAHVPQSTIAVPEDLPQS